MSDIVSRDPWIEDQNSYVAMFAPDMPYPLVERVEATPPLDNMQARVEGMIEHVRTGYINGKQFQLVCNEEGRLRGMRVNVAATEWLRTHWPLFRGQPALVGPIMVLIGPRAVMT